MNAPKPHVLCFSHDFWLMITRQLLLEKLECGVLCAMSLPELAARMQWKHVDLVLLCQTLTRCECLAAQELARLYAPDAPCMLMYVTHAQSREDVRTTLLRTSEGPLEFLRMIRRLLPVPPGVSILPLPGVAVC